MYILKKREMLYYRRVHTNKLTIYPNRYGLPSVKAYKVYRVSIHLKNSSIVLCSVFGLSPLYLALKHIQILDKFKVWFSDESKFRASVIQIETVFQFIFA